MDEPGGHCAKRNNPDKDRQIMHGITYMWDLKKIFFEHTETES